MITLEQLVAVSISWTSTALAYRWVRVAFWLIVMNLVMAGCAALNVHLERKRRAYLGDRLYTELRGDHGDPVVFIPGLMGTTRFWGDSIESLGNDHRVILVDLLGFGRSPWPADIDYSIDDQLQALRRTLVAEGATSHVTIVGHSLGSVVAAYYAARHPGEVERIVLLGVPIFRDRDDGRRRLWRMSYTAALFTLNRPVGRWTCAMMDAMRPLASQLAPLLRRDVPREVAIDAVMHYWKSADGSVQRILLSHPIEDALASIGHRTTILYGDRDSITPPLRFEELARRSGVDLVPTPSTHNSYPRDAAAELRRAIRSGTAE